jgi:phosphoserine phosphatase RsbU/P
MAVDENIVIAVADVSGKGMSAAILASLMQGIIYEAVLSGVSLPKIVRSVNDFLYAHHLESKYTTPVIAHPQPDGTPEYVNCAHVPAGRKK